ncbi:hypothetical protein CLAIMM_02483 [Cladophialophora immunda]|nr:hypothetical protein CLAIMM_02483 [Cladophialophora immunda]
MSSQPTNTADAMSLFGSSTVVLKNVKDGIDSMMFRGLLATELEASHITLRRKDTRESGYCPRALRPSSRLSSAWGALDGLDSLCSITNPANLSNPPPPPPAYPDCVPVRRQTPPAPAITMASVV